MPSAPTHAIPLTERTAFLTNRVAGLLLQATEARLAELELTTRSCFVLAGIDRDVPVSQQDLSRQLEIDPTTMVALVDALERRGLVRRARNAKDRRRYDLVLTETGTSRLASANAALAAAEQAFFAPLSETQRTLYDGFLRRLLGRRWP